MPVEESNNSLSDLYNRGFSFTDYLSQDDLNTINSGGNASVVQEREKLQQQIQKKRQQRQEASDEKKTQIDQEISDLQQKLDNVNKIDIFNSENPNASLFNRNGFIDYARVSNATQDWKQFNPINPDNPKDGFKLNTNVNIRENTPIPGDNQLKAADGLTPRHLVEWSERYPALQLRPQDFAYCKKLGVYPNNRLVVLRRFKNGVPDNLFDYHIKNSINNIQYLQPLSTLITWVRPDEDFIDMSFNENWKNYERGIIETIKGSIGLQSGDSETQASDGIGSNIFNNALLSVLLDTAGNIDASFKREDGVDFFQRSLDGNPNIIKRAKKRVTGGEGLESSISFNLKFDYEMRYINGIDPGYAMIDLIANTIRMGTSVSEFRFAVPALKNNSGIINAINGDFTTKFKTFFSSIKDFIDGTYTQLTTILSEGIDGLTDTFTNPKNNSESAVDKSLKFIISRYREELKAALSAETGLPSGIWHVTIGNPKNPIISCGDLILQSSKLKLGKEIGFNDFPNEFSVEYSLVSARERGRDELTRIFNAGRGRVYVYKDPTKNPDYDIFGDEFATANKETYLGTTRRQAGDANTDN